MNWLNWKLTKDQKAFLEFVRWLVQFREEQPIFRRQTFFTGTPVGPSQGKDVTWLHPLGHEMKTEEWEDPDLCTLGALFSGVEMGKGNFLLLQNGSGKTIPFALPIEKSVGVWELILDTSSGFRQMNFHRGISYPLGAHTLALFRLVTQ